MEIIIFSLSHGLYPLWTINPVRYGTRVRGFSGWKKSSGSLNGVFVSVDAGVQFAAIDCTGKLPSNKTFFQVTLTGVPRL
jgi:hypothetical protein